MTDIFSSLTLPNGQIVPNRLCKAAMEENMADGGQLPGQALFNLYQQWANGGVGMILTGNVMVAPDAMTGPGGVYLGGDSFTQDGVKAKFAQWANVGKSGGAKLYMQISHPGRQVYAAQGTEVVSASATKVSMDGPAASMFDTARALTGDEILGMIKRFADTAHAAEIAGFDGVQIHAAHGYLIAQFLSPLTNLREDEWGGPLENRARLLLEIVREVRARVEPSFGVAVKLNSADFQKGGFDVEDARRVVDWLNGEAVDFVELSGGSYESAAMMGMATDGRAQSTKDREMYFIDFAKDIAQAANMPLMVTGGVTKRKTAEAALATGDVDMIGIARAMGYNPNLPNDWKAGQNLHVALPVVGWKNPLFKGLANMAMTKMNLYRMGDNKPPKAKPSPLVSTLKQQIKQARQTARYKAWLQDRAG
ncbi:NADH:flavin oxidoreductase/NADH oxidase family protein [Litorimonas sp. RW-G-Af-16]|uniref:NADH:flavin oxidoreductase/NADH oxidase family protein n=1 Tax=Litorimonas sp. RW-G-Af-16 TaxID=3241168 RepID=UPI00390C6404